MATHSMVLGRSCEEFEIGDDKHEFKSRRHGGSVPIRSRDLHIDDEAVVRWTASCDGYTRESEMAKNPFRKPAAPIEGV